MRGPACLWSNGAGGGLTSCIAATVTGWNDSFAWSSNHGKTNVAIEMAGWSARLVLNRSGYELARRCGRARVHVAPAIQVIIDLCGAAQHARIKEDREGGRFELAFANFAGL